MSGDGAGAERLAYHGFCRRRAYMLEGTASPAKRKWTKHKYATLSKFGSLTCLLAHVVVLLKLLAGMEKCVVKCADQYRSTIPKMTDRIFASAK
eukprot:1185568-Prorocentrum_minimum.AAC.1